MSDLRNEETGRFIKQSAVVRFWAKVNKRGPDDCWPWMAGKDNWGYGMFWLEDRTLHASRVAWLLTNGSIPEGMEICHSCDNPLCVNPRHLFMGSQLVNIADRENKGRRDEHLPPISKGEKHPRAKLNDDLVRMARDAYKSGVYGAVGKLAKAYGVNYYTLYNAASNRVWKHIHP